MHIFRCRESREALGRRDKSRLTQRDELKFKKLYDPTKRSKANQGNVTARNWGKAAQRTQSGSQYRTRKVGLIKAGKCRQRRDFN